jgi:6-phosphogluconolactonase
LEGQRQFLVFREAKNLYEEAARQFMLAATDAIKERGIFRAALSGGSSPLPLYKLLADEGNTQGMDWGRVHFYWGDERCVPPEHTESNYGKAWDFFLQHIDIPQQNLHRIKGELGAEKAAQGYRLELKNTAFGALDWPRFDLVYLGMGVDGHTASLFPRSPVMNSSGFSAIAVKAEYQNRPADRVTLTAQVFNSARKIILIAVGQPKAELIATIAAGELDPTELPVQRIQPMNGELFWLLDDAAAGKLLDSQFRRGD